MSNIGYIVRANLISESYFYFVVGHNSILVSKCCDFVHFNSNLYFPNLNQKERNLPRGVHLLQLIPFPVFIPTYLLFFSLPPSHSLFFLFSQTPHFSTLKIPFILTHPLPSPLPPVPQLPFTPFRKLFQGRPVYIMVVFEQDVSAVGFEELFGGHVQAEIFVKGDFFAGEGVDEGADELEEGPEQPGYCFFPGGSPC